MDNLMSENTDHEKIKTCFAQIIAEKITGKPYYSIMYWQDGNMHIGYSSYDFEYVRQWLSEEFDVNRNADVAPVVHGRWVNAGDWALAKCSVCGEHYDVSDEATEERFKLFREFYRYCPHCGAKMDKEDSND